MTKSAQIHHIAGTFKSDRHKERLKNEQSNVERMPESKPVKPPAVKGKATKQWARLVALLPWLTEADSTPLAQYCCLNAEWGRDPERFTAAKLTAMRKLESDLGMNLMSRGKFKGPEGDPNGSGHFDD